LISNLSMQRDDKYRRYLLVLAVGLVPVLPAAGQETAGQRVYAEQLRVALDEQSPESREIGFDAGGWFSFALFSYDDAAARKTRTLRKYELRGWASFNIRGVHRAYVRGLLNWDDWNEGDNPITGRGDEFNERIERAWYQFDLGRLLRNQTHREPPVDFRLKVGRQFATIGTALVLSMPLDMVRFDLAADEWEFMAMLGKTLKHTRNIDDSDRVATHQDRCFYGFELAYRGFDHHRPFVYFLSNEDHTSPASEDPSQSYDYSSRYLGAGSEGAILLPDLRYQVELVGEWGKTYSEGVTTGRDRICAMAFDVLLEYLFQTHMHPKLMFEYLYASGDSDRRSSATATVGGNLAGTKDTAFNAFGFRDTGIAFAPRISNIHMYSFGASFFPLEKTKLFKKMEVGSKVFFYHKANASGPISDTTATNNARWLGWEWDTFCNWRITSDLAWTIRYGAFQPGSAYDGGEDSCRQFLFTGVVLSF